MVPARPATITLATIVAVLALLASHFELLELLELKAYDLRVRTRGRQEPSKAVILAAIDEKSLEEEGRWPWPRTKIAALIDALSADGASVIGMDVGFPEPEGDADAVLRRSIASSRAKVVLGYFFHRSREDVGHDLDPAEIARRVARVSASKYPVIASREPDLSRVPFLRAYAPQPDIETLTEVAASSGYFTFLGDPDGVLRSAPLAIQAGDEVFPSLALLCSWEYLGRPPLSLDVGPYGVDDVTLGDTVVQTDERGQLLVNYLGPPRTFPHVPVTDVLHGRTARGTFQGKVVLVGATAVGTHDLRTTPFSAVHPGLEIHATVVDNLLTGRLLSRPRWWKLFDVLAVVLLAVAIAVVLSRVGALAGLLALGLLFGGYVVLALWLFSSRGAWIGMTYPLLALTVNYTGIAAYRYLSEERERRKVRAAFQQYVAAEVVDEVLQDPGARLKLGGEEKVLTVLFCDLEGFTSYSEKYSPTEMIGILSEYYDRMTEKVFEHRGTLKEYVGDELMAFFGAPLEQPDHAERACATALAMRDARLRLNEEWAKLGRPRLRARTGVNTGKMLVGNLGSKYRFAYGVLGDDVNLGSRLEGLNRTFGTSILVGQGTAERVGDAFVLRELDRVRAKGKQHAISVHELVARSRSELTPDQRSVLDLYAAGLEAYRQRRWAEAASRFAESLRIAPDDGPSRTMVARCRTYERTAPPDAWDGVFEQTLQMLKDVG